jgi:methylenetetrahydrofolate reductase (NADPH)
MINNNDNKQGALAGLLDQAYLEVIPTTTIVERLVHIPRHSYVAITCSPATGIEPTLKIVEELRSLPEERQLKLIPHIAARMVRDKGHLCEIMARLDEMEIESIFIPGGDAPKALGNYAGSLELLRDIADIGHNIEDIGVAAHPEGHPLIDNDELMRLLVEKQALSTYLVTQMCFDPQVLVNWLSRIRLAGVTLPAWIGLPGVADMTKLISLSLRIGVGQSVNVLRKQKGLLKKVLSIKPYQPDDLVAGLVPCLNDPQMNIPGFHLFSFNDVERTERWRKEAFEHCSDERHK